MNLEADKEKQRSVLIQEIDVNLQEQLLLKKRICLMQECMNELPNYDPTYFSLDKQVLIDRLHLDELQRLEEDLIFRLRCLGP